MILPRPLPTRGMGVGVLVCGLALAALVGCGRDTARPALKTPAPRPAAGSPTEEVARLLTEGDYAGAETQYRRALRQSPDDVPLHYGLATVLSHLERLDEAREQFEWVVKHASRDREERALAQDWLAQLPPAESSEPPSGDEMETTPAGAGATAAVVEPGSTKGVTR